MMKKFILFAIIIVSIVVGGYFLLSAKDLGKKDQLEPMGQDTIKITSSAFSAGGTIPSKYACDGEDVNPPLQISAVPTDAKSLSLIVDDPDAPMGTWNHWLIWNIDPNITEIKENSIPKGGVFGTNDFGKLEYGGPCPPSGTHRYFFRLYALDAKLDLSEGAKRAELESAMKNHIIAQGQLMGKYSK
jgi:Raf kinase inhibitor-like YbhB/YbcL family protein